MIKDPKFNLDIEGEYAILTIQPTEYTGLQKIQIPCTLAGDIADAFNQLWLDWHSPEILASESESEPQMDRPFYKGEIPF